MTKRSTRRRTALFPGAFRPPHVNHHAAVAALVADPSIDDVVVIVTNRTRLIPGTPKALDVELSEAIWAIYLRDMPSVSVVRAKSSAVREAYDLVSSAEDGHDFVLVVGKKDYDGGTGRFSKLVGHDTSGRTVSVAPAADDVMPVSSSQLRGLLADGDGGRDAFEAALPAHLSDAERREVWTMCVESMVDQTDVASRRIAEVLDGIGGFSTDLLHAVDARHPHGAHRVRRLDGRIAVVKCANDAVAHDDDNPLKCRRRLKAEVSATKWVRRNVSSAVQVPRTEHYDRVSRTLVQSAVCVPGTTMFDEISQGRFSKGHLLAVGDFLGLAQSADDRPMPFWDDPRRDRDQWSTVIDHQLGLARRRLPAADAPLLDRLREASDQSLDQGFFHLDFTPANVRVQDQVLGVVDFERASTVGDRSFDLGTFVGWLLRAGHDSRRIMESLFAVHTVERAYAQRAGAMSGAAVSRAAGFAAVAMVAGPGEPSELVTRRASALLRAGLDDSGPTVGQAATQVCVGSAGASPVGDSGRAGGGRVFRSSLVSGSGSLSASLTASRSAGGNGLIVTLEMDGFEPRTTLDVVVDGRPVDHTEVDSLGQAFSAFETLSGSGRVEIRRRDVAVLSGELSAASDRG